MAQTRNKITIPLLTETELEHMYALAKAMLPKAYAPYSNFYVGVCLKSESGQYFTGCNIENASYSLVQCAEAAAIANMVIHGEQNLVAAVVVSSGQEYCSPCGACRQRFREFADDMVVYMFDDKKNHLIKTLNELLPLSFGPNHLT